MIYSTNSDTLGGKGNSAGASGVSHETLPAKLDTWLHGMGAVYLRFRANDGQQVGG